jgi:chromosome segregation ATPase
MNRRQYLIAVSAAVPLAGCASDNESATTDGDSTGQDETELLESAHEELENALNAFEAELDDINEVDSRISFEDEVIQAHLDQAESYLNDAEEGGAEQEGWIEAMRGVISLMRSFVDAFENLADGLDEFQTGATYFQNERYSDAESSFVEANKLINQSQDELVVAEEYFDGIDFGEFSDSSEIDRIEMENRFEDFSALNTDFEYLTRTYRDLARGFREFLPAGESFDSEQYNDAEEGFRSARNHFSSAASTIREGEESATDEFIDDFIGLTCLTEALRDAADNYASASEAASNSDWDTANSHAEDANDALERCDYQAT